MRIICKLSDNVVKNSSSVHSKNDETLLCTKRIFIFSVETFFRNENSDVVDGKGMK